MWPVWILHPPIKQHSTDSADEIFIPVSISHALIALYLSGETEEEIQTEAEREEEMRRERGRTQALYTLSNIYSSSSACRIHIHTSQFTVPVFTYIVALDLLIHFS